MAIHRSGPFFNNIIKRSGPYRQYTFRRAGGNITDAVDKDLDAVRQVPDAAVLRSPSFESSNATFDTEREVEDTLETDESSGLGSLWSSLPGKQKIIAATFLSFIVCNMVSEKVLVKHMNQKVFFKCLYALCLKVYHWDAH